MTRRQLVSSDEATPATRQHVRPCGDCPWARKALAGWLGGWSPAQWIKAAHGDGPIECHTMTGAQCAGSAIYRANIATLPRDPDVLRLSADKCRVFASPIEFITHHGGKK